MKMVAELNYRRYTNIALQGQKGLSFVYTLVTEAMLLKDFRISLSSSLQNNDEHNPKYREQWVKENEEGIK